MQSASNVVKFPGSDAFITDAPQPPTSTRSTVVVDAACDLPQAWFDRHNVLVLPITLHVDEWELVDNRDPFNTAEFFRKDIAVRGVGAQSTPLSMSQARDFLITNFAANHDNVIQIAIAASRSKTYMNSLAAAQQLMLVHGKVRRAAGIKTPFHMWVVDSENLFAGQGLLAAYTVDELERGTSAASVVERVSQLRQDVHTLVVPKDLYYIYKRAHLKGDRSINWLSYNVGKALDIKPVIHVHKGETRPALKIRHHDDALRRVFEIAAKEVSRGLSAPYVCVSYAGPLEAIEGMSSFQMLRLSAKQHHCELMLAPMSMTGGLNVGAEALSISFATRKPAFL